MKAIFIDGASLWHMGQALLLRGGISYPALYDVLTKKIGSEREFLSPIITVHPNNARLLGKLLRIAGYEVIPVESRGGRDDLLLKERIRTLDPAVSEIIMVSSDSDFVEELREKRKRGARVIIVATRARNRTSGTSAVGQIIEYAVDQGEFEFVELADFRKEIAFERRHAQQPEGMHLVIESEDDTQLPYFVAELAGILEKYPDLRLSVEGPWDREERA